MRRLVLTLVAVLLVAQTASGQRFVWNAQTLADGLARNPNDVHNTIFIQGRLAPGDGFEGEFIPVHNVTSTNLGTKFAMTSASGSGWSLQRLVPDKVYNVLWFATAAGAPTTAQIQNALNVGAGATVLFPPSGTYALTDTIQLQSDTHILGYGATISNGALSKSDWVMVQTTNKVNVTVEGLTIDAGVASHYDIGCLWFRGSDNCVAYRCTFKHGGYLGWFAVLGYPDLTDPSTFCGYRDCSFLDLRYGGSNQSLAGVSIAESPYGCFAINGYFDFPNLASYGLTYVPVGSGDPNAPFLVSSFDRAFNTDIRGNVYRNTSATTNLIALAIEDNSGATNIVNTVRDVTIKGYDIGIQVTLLNGDFTIDGGTIEGCTKWGIRMAQTESAEAHGVRTLTVNNLNLFGNYRTPDFTQVSGDWRNLGGNIVYVADSPLAMHLNNVKMYGWGGHTNQTGVLYGGGDLFLRDCTFRDLGYGIKAMDPMYPITSDDNGWWHNNPTNRTTFVNRGSRYINVTHPVWGLSDTYGSENLNSSLYKSRFFLEDTFVKAIPTNTVSTLFTIEAVDTTFSGFGTAIGYTAFIDLTISNVLPETGTNSRPGQVSSRGMGYHFNYAANYDSTPQAVTGDLISDYMTPQVKATGSGRGFTNIVPSVVTTPWHTTAVKLSADTETSDVSTVYVYGTVRLQYTGSLMPPQIIK